MIDAKLAKRLTPEQIAAVYVTEGTAQALNRIADALFQQAKVSGRQLRVSERQAAIQEQFLELQQANLAVTKQLEAALKWCGG